MIKYQKNIFHKFLEKIKSIFYKDKEIKVKTIKESVAEEKRYDLNDKIANAENNREHVEIDIMKLANKYETHQLKEQEMTENEKLKLREYYQKRIEELDREILRERAIWKSKVKQLEKTYESLKAQKSN